MATRRWPPRASRSRGASPPARVKTASLPARAPALRARRTHPQCSRARLRPSHASASFDTRSGVLSVSRARGLSRQSSGGAAPRGSRFEMSFPAWPHGAALQPPDDLIDALGGVAGPPSACYEIEPMHGAPYVLLVYETEGHVASLSPLMDRLEVNVLATAPANGSDPSGSSEENSPSEVDGSAHHFVSRFFGPRIGIPEDAVTGSAHCTLGPYWSDRLGLRTLRARQVASS